ncbi:MAG TPA: methyltransferase domain-containing protein [Usitatibacteraceae bacterium]|nr:methyltransferase domain-containing protein [Usitatibacteraceae bacterium]
MALFADPDRSRALAAYGALADGYEASSRRILGVREAAVAALDLKPGETVFDVACGTGATIPLLCRALGPEGRVLGIEQSPPMAAIARKRLPGCGCRGTLLEASVQDFATDLRADAMLFCYTHDVLQSPEALENLVRHAKPGCRVAVAGVRFLPWSWGFAVNAFTAWRTRHYLTTYRGLRAPWEGLAGRCATFRVVRSFHWGSSYLGVGRLK